eukprot:8977221-Pyramimonas_sp.AAC.1
MPPPPATSTVALKTPQKAPQLPAKRRAAMELSGLPAATDLELLQPRPTPRCRAPWGSPGTGPCSRGASWSSPRSRLSASP